MIPFEYVIWSSKECAEFLNITRTQFISETKYKDGFPRDLCSGQGHPRWRAMDVMAWAERGGMCESFVYRAFDRKDMLLYVGSTRSTQRRLDEHKSCSEWFKYATAFTFERFKSREAALEAEKKIIKKERPIFNVAHNRIDQETYLECA